MLEFRHYPTYVEVLDDTFIRSPVGFLHKKYDNSKFWLECPDVTCFSQEELEQIAAKLKELNNANQR